MGTCHSRFTVSAGTYVALALMLLLLPLKWIAACIFAAFFHEACHLLSVRLVSRDIVGIHIGSAGAVIETGEMTAGQELFCALAGPIGGGLLVLLGKWMPEVAICAAAQSAYNLLPLYPLDGGRALRSLASLVFSPKVSRRICIAAAFACLLGFSALAVYAAFFLRFGILPVLIVVLLCIRVKKNFLQTAKEEGTIVLP